MPLQSEAWNPCDGIEPQLRRNAPAAAARILGLPLTRDDQFIRNRPEPARTPTRRFARLHTCWNSIERRASVPAEIISKPRENGLASFARRSAVEANYCVVARRCSGRRFSQPRPSDPRQRFITPRPQYLRCSSRRPAEICQFRVGKRASTPSHSR